jgi:hypothetical protein
MTSRGVITILFMREQYSLEVSHSSDIKLISATSDLMRDSRPHIKNSEEGISKQAIILQVLCSMDRMGQ